MIRRQVLASALGRAPHALAAITASDLLVALVVDGAAAAASGAAVAGPVATSSGVVSLPAQRRRAQLATAPLPVR